MSEREQILSRFSRTEWQMYLAMGGGIPSGITREARILARSVAQEMYVAPAIIRPHQSQIFPAAAGVRDRDKTKCTEAA